MDDAWLRAVETALNGETNSASARSLTLDGAVKCFQGRLPSPNLLERFQSLEHLSIANIGLTTLEKFPQLRNLQKLILTDNRISGGLEFLVEAGLDSLRDLDLSNNRIQYVEDLTPLAELKLVSLDLYECPVTKTKDYRSRVFGLIRSLKYLDKMDVDDNERPESDEEDDEEEEEEEDEEEEDDPGSGEIDGEGWSGKMSNGARSSGGGAEGVLDVDEDEESDADEEETETGRGENGYNRAPNPVANGGASIDGDEEEDDGDEEEDGDLGEEIDEEDGEEEDVVEVHEIDDSDDEEDGVEEEDDDDDEEEVDEEVEDEEEDAERPSSGRVVSTEGEIDGHEQGEEDENGDEDENGEIGEEDGEYEEEDGEDEDEEDGEEFLVQPIGQGEQDAGGGSDLDAGNDEEEDGDEEVEDEEDPHNEVQRQPPSSSQSKRKRGDDSDDDDDDDSIVDAKSSKLR